MAAGTGEAGRAIAALQKLLSMPYEVLFAGGTVVLTPALLRLGPLRNDPRFQKLCQEPNK